MSFLKNIVKNAVSEGLNKGIKNAVSSAAEKIIAPKAEEYANKMAETLDEAAKTMNTSAASESSENAAKGPLSSLEASLNRLSQAAEKYAAAMETNTEAQEKLLEEWEEKLPGFPAWCFGGKNFQLDKIDGIENGTFYFFNAEDATEDGLAVYIALLKKDGFVQKYKGSDEVLYKDLGGEYLLFGTTDAFGTAPVMSISLGRTTDRSEIEA